MGMFNGGGVKLTIISRDRFRLGEGVVEPAPKFGSWGGAIHRH